MLYEIKVGTVSWIDATPNPMSRYTSFAAETKLFTPEWIPKTYLGLAATCNSAPPDPLTDFRGYQKNMDFRAMTFCHFRADIDNGAKGVMSFSLLDAFHDGGWTPPFKARYWPSTLFIFKKSMWSNFQYKGDSSPLSAVHTESRHPNTAISIVTKTEFLLVNALIKFRAGKHTDEIGINEVGSPYHVPWVWCELVLTYGQGQFRLYGRGSIFPSHAWYFNGRCVNKISQASDSKFPWTSKIPPVIAERQLKIYPVLTAGAPSSSPQQPLGDEKLRTGAVDEQLYTAGGGDEWVQAVKMSK